MERWNDGILGSWIEIILVEVGGTSACGGLEAEGQQYSALCLSEVILKLAPWSGGKPTPQGERS